MGIRFYCPQGHKLNVKSFLAGKKGFCPHCNAKVDIPVRSTRPSSKEDKQKLVQSAMVVPVTGPGVASPAPAHGAPLARPISAPTQNAPMALPVGAPGQHATVAGAAHASNSTPGHGPALAVPVAAPASVAVMSPPTSSAAVASPAASSSSATMPGAVAPAPQSTSGAPANDPIAEAPHAVWYVRPALGGQYGPASGDMLRQWIQQGRVAADSLVWRDGWPNWQPAGVILPQAAGSTPTGALPSASDVNLPMLLDPMPTPTKTTAGRGGTHKRSNLTVTIIVILLAVVALALAGVLIMMLSR